MIESQFILIKMFCIWDQKLVQSQKIFTKKTLTPQKYNLYFLVNANSEYVLHNYKTPTGVKMWSMETKKTLKYMFPF